MPTEQSSKPVVHVIAGFLGAGKTTLLRHILDGNEDLSDTAVIVNDFGAVGIDGTMLARGTMEVVELVSGCICCTLAADLSSTLEALSGKTKIRRMFIEATGIAEPSAIGSVLRNASLGSRIERGVTVGVLDGRMWKIRHNMGSFFLNQMRQVDLVILNKIDLVGTTAADEIAEEIRRELGASQVIPAEFCNVDLRHVLGAHHTGPGGGSTFASEAQTEFTHYEYETHRILTRQRIEDTLGNLPEEIYRAKGPVRLREETLLVNYAAGRVSWEKWPNPDPTCIVFVGRHMETSRIKSSLDACACD